MTQVVQQSVKAIIKAGKPLQARVGIPGPAGRDAALSSRELLAIASNGQTIFNLAAIPSLPHLSQLYLNGAKQGLGTDYLINSSTLTWLSAIALETTDQLEIYY